ncbi:hypothetical protein BBJ28_00027023, partial [Nothophytophthora sp. Chile5]
QVSHQSLQFSLQREQEHPATTRIPTPSSIMKPVGELIGDQREVALAATAVVALGLAVSLLRAKSTSEPRQLPLEPKTTLPVLKNVVDVVQNTPRFHDWLSETSIEFGHKPWRFAIPGRPDTIVLSSPELFEDVLKTQDNVFLRGPTAKHITKDLFGNSMITSDGDPWFFHRKTATHLFSMQMMKDVMEETVREKLGVFADMLAVYAARGKPVEMKDELSHFTMDTFCKIGFGVELDTLKIREEGEPDNGFLEAFDMASVAGGVRAQSPLWLWELKKFLNVGWEKVFMDNTKIIHNFINSIIVKSVTKKNEMAARGEKMEAKDLVTLFMESRLKYPDIQMEDDDATIMRDMVVTFIFGGKDATAHAMDWFIVEMNKHPEVLRKIREEMKEKLPELLTGELQLPTHAQLENLVYLEAVIRENMRLHPSTGFVVREAMEDTTLVDGTFVSKGSLAMMSSYCNARNADNWGEDAAEFKPERFIDPTTGKVRVFTPFQFSNFGAGQHQCIGQRFALLELKLSIATLWSKFDFKTVADPVEITYEFSLTIPIKGPLDVEVIALPAAPTPSTPSV